MEPSTCNKTEYVAAFSLLSDALTNETTASSASPSSESCSEEEEAQLAVISDVESLRKLLADLTPIEEPYSSAYPNILRISYSAPFDMVMGFYRAMRSQSCGQHAPSSPRWFLLTAFALAKGPSHYTLWKDRRDIVLHPTRLLQSTQEALRNDASGEQWSDEFQDTVKMWLPLSSDVSDPGGNYSRLRAVQWELKAIGCFNRKHTKNFQVWHHRKELLMEALADVDPEVLKSRSTFEEYLRTVHCMNFSDIDERSLCSDVLNNDNKNYHVWLHRSWFVHAVSFLVAPPSWDSLLECYQASEASNGSSGGGMRRAEDKMPPIRPFVMQNKVAKSNEAFTLPQCELRSELRYTAGLILEDCLNNSAWCHRFHIFNNDLITKLLQSGTHLRKVEVETVLRELCLEEMHYALQWCIYEPSNECSFTHSRSVALLYQGAALRLYLSSRASEVSGSAYLSGGITLASPFSKHFTNLRELVPWEVFIDTHSLLLQQLDVLRGAVTARAEQVRSSEAKRDGVTIAAIHRQRSQFLLDNIHQVYSARYFSLFALLEQLWLCYFDEKERFQVNCMFPPDGYTQGATAAMEQIMGLPEGPTKFFLGLELQALELARQLTRQDPIRVKLWKHEMMVVMHRNYN
ncbi:putative Protein prenyltransferase alpha subunit repeat [Trypanosoma vivax]|uniref:Protein farnesyltransferase/geranylgeranyltransferase type-1 subunit alpha n=1 Tax=Trypanosoma vivax (strain Y486) TaxID=1055687 RepID=G0TTB9_TRYVY|nr:putative Protein prenyltransferase alpha subunit repeat [Trypanosoma vivax]CCC47200.1 putative protein farnesyltransferase alpha subunit [Trypanosoma vivax Y486]